MFYAFTVAAASSEDKFFWLFTKRDFSFQAPLCTEEEKVPFSAAFVRIGDGVLDFIFEGKNSCSSLL